MISLLIIAVISILAMILLIIFKPQIKIKNINLQTFYFPIVIGAILILAFGFLDGQTAWQGLTNHSAINPLKLLVIFFSLSFISIVLDETGFFSFLASAAVKKAHGSQIKLFLILYLLVSVLTIFTSNDIIILTFTPFIIFFCKRTNINPLPYLVSEFIAANSWSLFLIIGNPTNIYLAESFSISFLDYTKVMFWPTILVGLTSFLILFLLFYRQLKMKIVLLSSSSEKIKTPVAMYVALGVLLSCMFCLAISYYFDIEMYIITSGAALSLLIFMIIYTLINRNNHSLINSIKRLPYTLIPFVLGMFLIVLALSEQHVTEKIAIFFGDHNSLLTYGLSSFVASNLINNIPMTVFYQQIITSGTSSIVPDSIYACILASNVGAFLTPIGSLAGLMWMSLLKKYQVKYSFARFTLYGLLIGIPSMMMGLLGLFISLL